MKGVYRTVAGAVACVLLVAGCASVRQFNRMDSFDKAAKAYAKAVTWSDFDKAAILLPPQFEENRPLDLNALKQIRVTHYQVKRFQATPRADEVRQEVEISYYRIDDMRVETLRDPQRWVYNAETGHWYIHSGLPAFELQ